MNPVKALENHGQSIWLDFLARGFVSKGDLHHLPEFDRLEIGHFFTIYKELEPGKSVEGAHWVNRSEAEREIRISWQRARDADGSSELQPDPGV